jgi:hypothetical protein
MHDPPTASDAKGETMRDLRLETIVLLAALLGATGCATQTELAAWKAHTTHFASTEHLTFSVRNDARSTPVVTRSDVDRARNEQWWGDPVTVSPDAIVDAPGRAGHRAATEESAP